MRTDNRELRYMIIGAGGTGGAIGSHLALAGYDVTFIARGRNLEAMRTEGLRLHRPDMEFTVNPVKACTSDEFLENNEPSPDVIFVCVKCYSVGNIIPFIEQVSNPDTIVIPILNVFGTGAVMQRSLPDFTVLDGCIYIWTELKEPGLIWMGGTIFRVVYGLRRDQRHLSEELDPILRKIKSDLDSSGIAGIYSDNIERDALRKFSYVSPQGAIGLYYNTTVGAAQTPGEVRDTFAGLVREVSAIADAMDAGFGEDIVPVNLGITDKSDPGSITSMQRDVAAGRQSEVDGLIYEVVRMGEKYGVDVPLYRMVADELRSRGLR